MNFFKRTKPLTLNEVVGMDEKSTLQNLANYLSDYITERILWLLQDLQRAEGEISSNQSQISDRVHTEVYTILGQLHYDDAKEMLMELVKEKRFLIQSPARNKLTRLMNEIMRKIGISVRYSQKTKKRELFTLSKDKH